MALNEAIGTADPEELAGRASSALPAESRNMVVPATVDLGIAAGPRQQMLRPVEIMAPVRRSGSIAPGLSRTCWCR